jgi:hypothetical protein
VTQSSHDRLAIFGRAPVVPGSFVLSRDRLAITTHYCIIVLNLGQEIRKTILFNIVKSATGS